MTDFSIMINHLLLRLKYIKIKLYCDEKTTFSQTQTQKISFSLNSQLGRIEALRNKNSAEVLGKYQYLSQGDDGFVLRYIPEMPDEESHVIKVFKPPQTTEDTENLPVKELQHISLDQAKREFSGLSLMKGHPNVPLLLSSEVDVCDLFIDEVEYPQAYAIKLSYISNLRPCGPRALTEAFGAIITDEGFKIDYGHRNKLAKYLWGQAASLSKALKELSIYHRDVDNVNLKIQTPDLRLILMDFARAAIPVKENLPFTEDPDMLCDENLFLDRARTIVGFHDTNEDIINKQIQLFHLQKKRLLNINEQSVLNEPELKIDQSNQRVQDFELLYYWITYAIHRHNDHFLYRHEMKYTEDVMIPQVKEMFLYDFEKLIQWAVCPEDDLIQFKKVFTLSEQKSEEYVQIFVKCLKQIPIVHSNDFLEYYAK